MKLNEARNVIYWTDTFPREPTIEPVALPETCDAVVIGGGVTGLSAALHLARNGASVHLFESDRMGSGASTRNAGMTLAGLKHSPRQLIGLHGVERAVRLYRASLDAIDFAEALIGRENIDCGFKRYGVVWAAYTPGHFESFSETRRLLKDTFGHETHLVSRSELPGELGSPIYHGGLVDPLSAGLHPARLIQGLLHRNVEAGVGVHEQTPVTGLVRDNGRFRVETARGPLQAENVVVATNGYTPPFLASLRKRVIPIGSYILVTEALPAEIANELIPKGRMVYDTRNFLNYFRMVDGNRLMFGGRTSFRRIDDAEAAGRLYANMLEVFPQLESRQADYFWSGYVCFTFNKMPHLGRRDGIYYALGYCGHGVAMGLYAGAMVARLMAGEGVEFPYRDVPFESRFYYRRHPWFLPLAGTYYKMLDRLAR